MKVYQVKQGGRHVTWFIFSTKELAEKKIRELKSDWYTEQYGFYIVETVVDNDERIDF